MPRQSQSTTNASSRRSDFSLFTRVKARKPAGSLSLPELEQWIRYNKRPVELANLPDVRALTKEIRAHYERHGKDAGYQTRKKGLPVFTPAGIFSQRNKSGLEKHSSFIPWTSTIFPPPRTRRPQSSNCKGSLSSPLPLGASPTAFGPSRRSIRHLPTPWNTQRLGMQLSRASDCSLRI